MTACLFALLAHGCEFRQAEETAVRGAEEGWGTVEAQVELRIGVAEGAPEYTFGSISQLAAGLDGSIYVAERAPTPVRQFDSEGRYVRDIGGRGQGPGEYGERVMGLRVVSDGTLALWDAGNARLNVYAPDGAFRDSFAVSARLYSADLLHFDLRGRFYVKDVLRGFEQLRLMAYGPGGEPLEPVPLPPADEVGGGFVLSSSQGFMRNFPTVTVSAWSPLGYVVAGRNDRYAIELRDGELPVRTIVRNVPRADFHPEERRQWQAWVEHVRTVQPSTPAPARAPDLSDTPDVPGVKPFFKDIAVGDHGRIWVHRYVEAEEVESPRRAVDDERPPMTWREPATFDVFDPDGTFLGTVVLPPSIWIAVRRDDRLWGIETGPDDNPYVVRLRIPGASVDPRGADVPDLER